MATSRPWGWDSMATTGVPKSTTSSRRRRRAGREASRTSTTTLPPCSATVARVSGLGSFTRTRPSPAGPRWKSMPRNSGPLAVLGAALGGATGAGTARGEVTADSLMAMLMRSPWLWTR